MQEKYNILLKNFAFVDLLDSYADISMRIEACCDAVVKLNGEAVIIDLLDILLQHQTEVTKLKLKLSEYEISEDEIPYLLVHREDYI